MLNRRIWLVYSSYANRQQLDADTCPPCPYMHHEYASLSHKTTTQSWLAQIYMHNKIYVYISKSYPNNCLPFFFILLGYLSNLLFQFTFLVSVLSSANYFDALSKAPLFFSLFCFLVYIGFQSKMCCHVDDIAREVAYA